MEEIDSSRGNKLDEEWPTFLSPEKRTFNNSFESSVPVTHNRTPVTLNNATTPTNGSRNNSVGSGDDADNNPDASPKTPAINQTSGEKGKLTVIALAISSEIFVTTESSSASYVPTFCLTAVQMTFRLLSSVFCPSPLLFATA